MKNTDKILKNVLGTIDDPVREKHVQSFANNNNKHHIRIARIKKAFSFICTLFAFLMTACAPQAYVTLRSEPSGAHLYTSSEKFVGVTPYTLRLDNIPVEAQEKGVLELGQLVAYKEGYDPVARRINLPVEANKKSKKLFQTEITEWEFLFDFNSEQSEKQSKTGDDFFACNYWLDEDQNSCISRREFQGIKDHFRMHEKVTFVALFKQGAGVNYSYALEAPDGSIYQRNLNNKTRFKNAMAQAEFQVRDLVNNKGIGQWRMQWMIEGNPVAITAVNLTR